jgi:hypothetical protein
MVSLLDQTLTGVDRPRITAREMLFNPSRPSGDDQNTKTQSAITQKWLTSLMIWRLTEPHFWHSLWIWLAILFLLSPSSFFFLFLLSGIISEPSGWWGINYDLCRVDHTSMMDMKGRTTYLLPDNFCIPSICQIFWTGGSDHHFLLKVGQVCPYGVIVRSNGISVHLTKRK